jgi:uncharacterized protein (UPF0261 family)
LTDELVGGVLTAGPDRMEAAGLAGIPQVLIPGALDVVNFGAEPTVPDKFRIPERLLHVHNPAVTIVRTNLEESRYLGEIFVEKANKATGPTAIVLPLKGLSALDAPGQPWENPENDKALFDAIRERVRPRHQAHRGGCCGQRPRVRRRHCCGVPRSLGAAMSSRALLAVGVGSGLTAAGAVAGGADLLACYSTACYRVMGLSSTLAFLPYDDANELVTSVLPEVLNAAGTVPVVAGVGVHDPRVNVQRRIDELAAQGVAGVTNEPFVGIYEGDLRDQLEAAGLGYERNLS